MHISTKLNRSHLVTGKDALILPTLGRTELDMQASGSQYITVEDSFSMVHASEGIGKPLAETQRSETAIVCGIADAVLGTQQLDWLELADDYSLIRDHIAATIPGFEDFNRRCDQPGGFYRAMPPPNCASPRQAARQNSAPPRCRPPCSRSWAASKRRLPCRRCARTISTTPPFMAWMTVIAAFTANAKCCSSIRRIWRRWACRMANG